MMRYTMKLYQRVLGEMGGKFMGEFVLDALNDQEAVHEVERRIRDSKPGYYGKLFDRNGNRISVPGRLG